MVKQAEKIRKRSPLLPVFGLLLVLGLGVIAFMLSFIVVQWSVVKPSMMGLPPLLIGNKNIQVFGANLTWGHVGFTLGIWFLLAALSYFVVTLAVGKDPESAKEVPLPPKEEKKKKSTRR